MSQIFGASGAVGAVDESTGQATAGLKSLGNVELALYTGQFTRDERSGIDFVVVGDINPTQLAKYVGDLEAKEGKTIRYAVMDKEEFLYRKQVNDRFLLTVLDSKKQVLIDRPGLIAEEEPEQAAEAETDPAPKPKDKKEKAKK